MSKKTFTVRATNNGSFEGYQFVLEDGTPKHYINPADPDNKEKDFDQATIDPFDPERFRCKFEGYAVTLSKHLHGSTRPSFLYGRETFDPGKGGTAVWVAEEDGTAPEPPNG